MKRHLVGRMMWAAALLAMASLVLSACAQAQSNDLLGQVKARGTLRISTDPNYKPQSFLNEKGELDGFDIDVSKEIAKRLGVKPDFTTPAWDLITSGNWGGRWDLSIGSMTITPERKKALYFSVPYYYTPAQFAAPPNSGITKIEDFVGKTVCVGAATTYEDYLNGKLTLEGEKVLKQVTGIKVYTFETDQECIQALQAGRTEFQGVLTAAPTVEDSIKSGMSLRPVGDPVYYEDLAAAADKSVPTSESLIKEVSKAFEQMHKDGTLTNLSMKWYGIDLTKKK